jgi:putative ABC transport system substrate-binding protein
MKRREFISLLGGAAVALPAGAHGQQTPRTVPLVGVLYIGEPSAPISVSARDAFEQGLRESGYIERQNIFIEHRYAKDPDEINRAMNDLVALRVDVIMTLGTPASLTAKRATSSIPIVAANMADPVRTGWWPVFPGRGEISPATPSSDRN